MVFEFRPNCPRIHEFPSRLQASEMRLFLLAGTGSPYSLAGHQVACVPRYHWIERGALREHITASRSRSRSRSFILGTNKSTKKDRRAARTPNWSQTGNALCDFVISRSEYAGVLRSKPWVGMIYLTIPRKQGKQQGFQFFGGWHKYPQTHEP